MCRLFGMSGGPEPVTARFWLLQAPDSLAQQSHREPDGTGIGWYDAAGAPHIAKQPQAAYADAAFAHEARELASRTFVAHIRYATTGALDVKNTHPFEQDGRLFAHNGVIEDLPALEAELGADLSLVAGDTDSERIFALITRETRRAGGDVSAGIAAAVGWIATHLRMLAANFVLIDAGELWALRYPDVHDLYVLERPAGGGADGGDAPLRHARGGRIRAESADLARRPAVVIATEPMDEDPGWTLIPSGELVHVAADLTVTRRRVIDHPPAHPLSLAELTGRAAAAQTA